MKWARHVETNYAYTANVHLILVFFFKAPDSSEFARTIVLSKMMSLCWWEVFFFWCWSFWLRLVLGAGALSKQCKKIVFELKLQGHGNGSIDGNGWVLRKRPKDSEMEGKGIETKRALKVICIAKETRIRGWKKSLRGKGDAIEGCAP